MRALRLAIAVALFGLSSVAHADKAKSLEIYSQGKAKYQAGEYQAAIALFEKAYAEHPSPAYLFNTAQSYRQLSDCPNALRYYRKFVAEKPDSADAARPYIDELEAECGGQTADQPGDQKLANADEPETSDGDPVENADDTATGGGVTDGGTTGGSVTPEPARGPLIALTAEVGASFFDVGDVVTPVTATLRLGAAYPLDVGPVTLELGAVVELARMPYEEATGDSTATWTTVLANAGVVYPVGKLRFGGELGLGLVVLSSLEAGNPFIDQMEAASGSSVLGVRIGGSAEYELFDGLAASLSPAFVYASAADGFREEISSVTRIEVLGGARYRW